MTTRELLRRRREEQVSVFAHTRVYRIYGCIKCYYYSILI